MLTPTYAMRITAGADASVDLKVKLTWRDIAGRVATALLDGEIALLEIPHHAVGIALEHEPCDLDVVVDMEAVFAPGSSVPIP